MTTSRLFGSISAIALLTVAVPPAFAGGGMGIGTTTTACRTIVNGVNPPQTVSLISATTPGVTGEVVSVGPALLLCELVTGTTVNPPKGPQAPPTQGVVNPDSFVCYPVQGPNKDKQTVSVTDPFTAADPLNQFQTVTVTGFSLLCVEARTAP